MSTNHPAFTVSDIPSDAHIAIVAARFNAHVVDELVRACRARLLELGLDDSRVILHRVPGAFELPVAAKLLAVTKKYAAVICLGCVIRGETAHFEHVAGQAAAGIQKVAIEESLPVIFGVLTTDTEAQAQARIGGSHGHAGISAAEAALEMIAFANQIRM